jgi:hypothetical protein
MKMSKKRIALNIVVRILWVASVAILGTVLLLHTAEKCGTTNFFPEYFLWMSYGLLSWVVAKHVVYAEFK